jgi:hypothetical protein
MPCGCIFVDAGQGVWQDLPVNYVGGRRHTFTAYLALSPLVVGVQSFISLEFRDQVGNCALPAKMTLRLPAGGRYRLQNNAVLASRTLISSLCVLVFAGDGRGAGPAHRATARRISSSGFVPFEVTLDVYGGSDLEDMPVRVAFAFSGQGQGPGPPSVSVPLGLPAMNLWLAAGFSPFIDFTELCTSAAPTTTTTSTR